jgi:hypothetical protein
MNNNTTTRIVELERQIADLQARLPKHSVPTSMLIELDDLEEELEQARIKLAQEEGQR